jgi:hypothetical protein
MVGSIVLGTCPSSHYRYTLKFWREASLLLQSFSIGEPMVSHHFKVNRELSLTITDMKHDTHFVLWILFNAAYAVYASAWASLSEYDNCFD